MHSSGFFLQDVAGFLGGYYAFVALMNGIAALVLWRNKGQVGWALVWTAFSIAMMVLASLALSASPELVPALPASVRAAVNRFSGPVLYTLGTFALLAALFVFRKFFVRPMVAWGLLNAMLLLMGLSMADQNFASIVMKPDNVPIVGLVFMLAFFTWLATKQAVVNDDRIARGLPTVEKENDEKVLVWPDLVYTELICMVAVSASSGRSACRHHSRNRRAASRPPIPPRRRGTSSDCRRCSSTLTRGTPAWCCRAWSSSA